jgi:4-diphosphocytidyl-2-C-methyl-D-erythritol kinase
MLAVSYAKINLFLEIRGKLPGGYHEVDTLLASIGLFDSIKYTLTKKQGIKTWCEVPELCTENNLMTRVAGYMWQKYHPTTGVEMHLDKRIPITAGLGGGSSNAANVIRALNSLWELNLTDKEMHSLAAEHGSDVNFFLEGGVCFGSGRGEKITPTHDIVLDHILLVNPGIAISSREAYQLATFEHEPRHFDPARPLESCFNRLENGICEKYPAVRSILSKMTRLGARVAMMSGSGSTCFGVFDDDNALESCRAEFSADRFWTYATRTITRDEYQQCFPSLN